VSSYGAANGFTNDVHQDLTSYASYPSQRSAVGFHRGLEHEFSDTDIQQTFVQSVPISEHVEVTNPVAVPVVKNIGEIRR